jgi:hypothetical protein
MSPVRIALGWDVTVARNGAPDVGGRIVFTGGPEWLSNDALPSYPGYDSSTYETVHDALLGDIVEWLTGKTSGATVLILSATSTNAFGTAFRTGLSGLGHTYDVTGSDTGWGAYDPADYDMICLVGAAAGTFRDEVDAYVAAGGSALAYLTPTAGYWDRYGVSKSGYQTQSYPSLPLLSITIFGTSHQYVTYATAKLTTATNTIGGTTTMVQNNYSEYAFAQWEL